MKVVAIDPGEKRIGMAVSDPEGKMALALPVYAVKADGRDAERVADLIRKQDAEAVVVGLPVNMDGTEGPAAARAREFAAEMRLYLEVPVEFVDERLTSEEARRRLRGVPLGRDRKRAHVNTVAAQIILESFLQSRGR